MTASPPPPGVTVLRVRADLFPLPPIYRFLGPPSESCTPAGDGVLLLERTTDAVRDHILLSGAPIDDQLLFLPVRWGRTDTSSPPEGVGVDESGDGNLIPQRGEQAPRVVISVVSPLSCPSRDATDEEDDHDASGTPFTEAFYEVKHCHPLLMDILSFFHEEGEDAAGATGAARPVKQWSVRAVMRTARTRDSVTDHHGDNATRDTHTRKELDKEVASPLVAATPPVHSEPPTDGAPAGRLLRLRRAAARWHFHALLYFLPAGYRRTHWVPPDDYDAPLDVKQLIVMASVVITDMCLFWVYVEYLRREAANEPIDDLLNPDSQGTVNPPDPDWPPVELALLRILFDVHFERTLITDVGHGGSPATMKAPPSFTPPPEVSVLVHRLRTWSSFLEWCVLHMAAPLLSLSSGDKSPSPSTTSGSDSDCSPTPQPRQPSTSGTSVNAPATPVPTAARRCSDEFLGFRAPDDGEVSSSTPPPPPPDVANTYTPSVRSSTSATSSAEAPGVVGHPSEGPPGGATREAVPPHTALPSHTATAHVTAASFHSDAAMAGVQQPPHPYALETSASPLLVVCQAATTRLPHLLAAETASLADSSERTGSGVGIAAPSSHRSPHQCHASTRSGSAASFIAELSRIVSQVDTMRAHGATHLIDQSSGAKASGVMGGSAYYEALSRQHLQLQLEHIRQQHLFPSLQLLDELNTLPYHLHVWYYSYDPLHDPKRHRSFMENFTMKNTLASRMLEGARTIWHAVSAGLMAATIAAASGGGVASASAATDGKSSTATSGAVPPAGFSNDPSLYLSVCALYITAEDIVLRTVPTERMQEQRRRCQRHRSGRGQGHPTSPLQQHAATRTHRTQSAPHPQPSRGTTWHHASYGSGDATNGAPLFSETFDCAPYGHQPLHPRQQEDDDSDSDSDHDAQPVEAELNLLPRVAIVSLTRYTVNRAADGVFSEKCVHKIFMADECDPHLHRHGGGRPMGPGQPGAPLTHATLKPFLAARRWEVAPSSTAAMLTRSPLLSVVGGRSTPAGASTTTPAAGGAPSSITSRWRLLGPSQAAATATRKSADLHASRAVVHGAGTGGTAAAVGVAAASDVARQTCSVVLRIEMKSMQALWLEFADEETLDYVYDLLQRPLSPRDSLAKSICAAASVAHAPPARPPAAPGGSTPSPPSPLVTDRRDPAPSGVNSLAPPTASAAAHSAARRPPILLAPATETITDYTATTAAAGAVGLRGPSGGGVAPASPQPAAAANPSGQSAAALLLPSSLQAIASSPLKWLACTPFLSTPVSGNRFITSARRPWPMLNLCLIAGGVFAPESGRSPYHAQLLRNVSVAWAVNTLYGPMLPEGPANMVVGSSPSHAAAPFTDAPTASTPSANFGDSTPTSRRPPPQLPPASAAASTPNPTSWRRASPLSHTWWLYDPDREFVRQSLSSPSWRLSRVNHDYHLSPTYPAAFVVPGRVEPELESGSMDGHHRTSQRLEAATYSYAPTGGTLVRSAQPAVVRHYLQASSASATASEMFSAAGDGTAEAAGGAPALMAPNQQKPPVLLRVLDAFARAADVPHHRLLVLDLRTPSAALANTARGGGTMTFVQETVEYAHLLNIHGVLEAARLLRAALFDGPMLLNPSSRHLWSSGEPPYVAVVATAETTTGTGGTSGGGASFGRDSTATRVLYNRSNAAAMASTTSAGSRNHPTTTDASPGTAVAAAEDARKELDDTPHNSHAYWEQQHPWQGALHALLSTAVTAARRVCGLPVDPLYSPAMEHNGADANCFSHIVGHDFYQIALAPPNTGYFQTAATAAPAPRPATAQSSNHHAMPSHRPPLPTRHTEGYDQPLASYLSEVHAALAHVVLLNCTDGWDRTSQVAALTQLLLDPYFRTVEGFCILVEKDFVAFGHPARRRATAIDGNRRVGVPCRAPASGGGAVRRDGASPEDAPERDDWKVLWPTAADDVPTAPSTRMMMMMGSAPATAAPPASTRSGVLHDSPEETTHQYSPILLQFFDCVRQLVRLYPSAFEFTESFLLLIVDLMHAGLLSSFGVNCEADVRGEAAMDGCLSLSQWCALILSTTTPSCDAAPPPRPPMPPTGLGGTTKQPPATAATTTVGRGAANTTPPAVAALRPSRSSLESFVPIDSRATPERSLASCELFGEESQLYPPPVRAVAAVPRQLPSLVKKFIIAKLHGGVNATHRRTFVSGMPDDDPTACGMAVPHWFLSWSIPQSQGSQQHCSVRANRTPSPTDRDDSITTFDWSTRLQPRRRNCNKGVGPLASLCATHPLSSSLPRKEHEQRQMLLPQSQCSSDYHSPSHVQSLRHPAHTYTERLLPISQAAMRYSGYLNPQFSLRTNSVVVGPLVDYIPITRLTIWEAFFLRHSFWEERRSRLNAVTAHLASDGRLYRDPHPRSPPSRGQHHLSHSASSTVRSPVGGTRQPAEKGNAARSGGSTNLFNFHLASDSENDDDDSFEQECDAGFSG